MRYSTPVRRFALCALFALLVPGCLEFSTQTIEFEFDAANDRAVLHLVYHGLWSSEGKTSELKRAVEGDEFCLVDWPFHVQPRKADKAKVPLVKLMLENLEVIPVGFFTNARGELAAGQIVVLKNVSKILDAANAWFNGLLAANEGMPEGVGWDKETAALMLAAAKRKHNWWRMRGNAVEWHGFLSESDFVKVKRDFLRQLVGEDKKAILEFWSRFPVSYLRSGTSLLVVLGDPGGRTRLEVPALDAKAYQPNLVDYVRKEWGFQLDGKIAPLLVSPDDSLLGRFACAMGKRERIRLLLTRPGEQADARLKAELRGLTDEPVDDLRGFWKRWLAAQSGNGKDGPERAAESAAEPEAAPPQPPK